MELNKNNKTLINKINVYMNQSNRKDTKKVFMDDYGALYLTDTFSTIKLFDTTYNRKNRFILLDNFEQDDSSLKNTVINLHENFEKQNFNIKVDEKGHFIDNWDGQKYCFFGDNELHFNCKKINRIKKIISTDGNVSYFLSNDNKYAVCIVGKNGVAFLLGCKTY